jgi:hypothetical protein
MTSFDLLKNYVEDPEALIKRTKAKVLALEAEDNQTRRNLTPVFEAMANKTLCEFSALTTANIRTRPTITIGDNAFDLKPALINMMQASQFCGKAHEDASAHLLHFLEICSCQCFVNRTSKLKRLPCYSRKTMVASKIHEDLYWFRLEPYVQSQ